ncbi:5'-methylthioadenosine/S-adenosylhomocysteine nucleosidase [Amphibacillus sediminis]|uniref:5'-methylthioadenosine/S-adenosylhomocysteine nucleosidase n=1 Tax=Amphibacillus sediminis TaxID=360185 RepID=UPI00082F1904|nr:5'-methylthioadenosine/S-adenosylhomocysteine nucleosidase [Amphibacillus sediminis]
MTIGIIGAMDQEISMLKNNMEIESEITIANCTFIKGTLNHKAVVLLKSGIGKVNAALATTILHERYKPAYVINTGSAGGLATDLNVGDIVIGSEVIHHDVDVTAFDYQYGQVPGMPVTYQADQVLIQQVEKVLETFASIASKQGLIATGDSFMSDPNRVNAVRKLIPEVMAVEMEAAAIAQVCYQYEVPFVTIRALSDIAGKESHLSFDQFLDLAAKHAAELIIKVIENL